jgi:hypothetical protein
MKSIVLASTLALVSGLSSVAAVAQTGRPSEAPASIARSDVIDTSSDAAGSYARYLMLNGATREAAIRAAQPIDHPQPRRLAWQRVQRGDAAQPAPTR